jgi:hypothetical protein
LRTIGRGRRFQDLEGDEPLAVSRRRVVEEPAREVPGMGVLARSEPRARGHERSLVKAFLFVGEL